MKLAIISVAIIGVVLYILFSDPKPICNEIRTQGRDSLLFRSSLKSNNYPSTKEIFKTLEDAGLESCFLKEDLGG